MLDLVVTSRLGELAVAWDALLDRQPHPTPHLRSWWLQAMAAGQPLFVLTFDQERLVGGVALEVDRWRGVDRGRVMASGSWSSGFDLIAEPGRETEVVAALGEWIRSSHIRLYDLSGVLGDARLLDVLPGTVRREESGSAWIIDLPSNFEHYLTAKSRDFRRDLSRARRRVADAGMEARLVPVEETERALETFEVLHRAQFGDQSIFMPYFPAFASAARVGVETGEVAFVELVTTVGETVEIEVWLLVGGGAWGLVGGRGPEAVRGSGTVLRAWALERFCETGIQRVDLGGGYGYWKGSWATGRRTQLRVTAVRGVRPSLILGAGRTLLRARNRLRSLLGRSSSGPPI